MLSVGRRDGAGGIGKQRKGLGLGFGNMEETELEEGEAYDYSDDRAGYDPDVAFSYIDEKLQDVLGHYQKDFEGEVSAENLGAKFGGYGSFLPTYQRSPSIWSHPKSPVRGQNVSTTISPNGQPVECTRQNPSVPMHAVIPSKVAPAPSNARPGATFLFDDNSTRRGTCISSQVDVRPSPKYEASTKNVNGTENTLKVRIRVGPDSKNAALYSGLGLDNSPSSSLDDSLDDSDEGLSPETRDVPDESPSTILQIMTSFQVPGGILLSPLPHFLLRLTKKDKPFRKESKSGSAQKGSQECGTMPISDSSCVQDLKGPREKKTKTGEKHGRLGEAKNKNDRGIGNDMSSLLKKEIDIETPAGRELVSDALNIPVLSSLKGSQEKLGSVFSSGTINEETHEAEGIQDSKKVSKGSNESVNGKGKLNVKAGLAEKSLDEKNPNIYKESDLRKDLKFDTLKDPPDGNKGRKEKDQNTVIVEPPRSKFSHKAMPPERDSSKLRQGKDQLSGGKKKSKESQMNLLYGGELPKEKSKDVPPGTVKDKKKNMHAKDFSSEIHYDMIKSQKESNKVFERDLKNDLAESRTDTTEIHFKEKPKEPKLEHLEKEPEMANERLDYRNIENPSSVLGQEPVAAPPLAGAGLASDGPLPVPAGPVVIEEDWVCCDKCETWRILPFGMNPQLLPKKWLCSMQTWLRPGLNKCSVSEEETSKALRAMYQVPEDQSNLHNQHDRVGSGVTLADTKPIGQGLEPTSLKSGAMPGGGKKGIMPKDAANAPGLGVLNYIPNSVRKNQQTSKSKVLNDATQFPSEPSQLNKVSVKGTELIGEKPKHKLKEKHKLLERSSDGGGYAEHGKHSKSKHKREPEKDGSRTSKKSKIEGSLYGNGDCSFDQAAPFSGNGLPTKLDSKSVQRYNDCASSKDSKCDTSLPMGSKLKEHGQSPLDGDYKANVKANDIGKIDKKDIHSKKRKMKEWHGCPEFSEDQQVRVDFPDTRVSMKLETSETERRKEKKTKISKSDGKESSSSKAEGRCDKKGRTKILFSSSRDPLFDGMDGENGSVSEKDHQLGHSRGSSMLQRASDGIDSSKRDLGLVQPPFQAATSSSSKVSGSRKTKGNLQEAKGSPVESVSSSPMRVSKAEMFVTAKRNILSVTGSPKGDSSALHSISGAYDNHDRNCLQISGGKSKIGLPSKSLDGSNIDLVLSDAGNTHELNDADPSEHGKDRDQVKKSNYYHLNNSSYILKAGKVNVSRSKERENGDRINSDKGKVKVSDSFSDDQDDLYLTKSSGSYLCEGDFEAQARDSSPCPDELRDDKYEFLENSRSKSDRNEKNHLAKKAHATKRVGESRRENHSKCVLHENSSDQGSRYKDGKTSWQRNQQRVTPQEEEKPSSQTDRAEVASSRGKSQVCLPSGDKQELRDHFSRESPMLQKGFRAEVMAIEVSNVDGSKGPKQQRKSDNLNSTHPTGLRHPTPNGLVSKDLDAPSPFRKDHGQTAANAIKEATDLKHTADRLKNGGQELESTGLYFRAALKFLHGASLLEPCNVEGAKHGDTTQSMQVYSDTARLCEFCAVSYERNREMAAAALAYKCVEVAYMRVIFSKHPCARNDRIELQTALQMVPPGESPSSSASDVDNVNNHHATGDKISSATKGAVSPLTAGNHVIAARNRPSFLRMLNFAQDMNSAMEALRNLQRAFLAANGSVEESTYGEEGISSVRRVLEFHFHDVEGLLRLVRLAMEAISR
ncbi:uncharacterized protein LOC18445287 isoform X1 [Amborella trichopoda]|uniref:CW-type domain-containing protein n=1 Tax=Amborella trichopoda TaxID=13333 RepID=U5D3Y8_AMBTC|nr:uncharacterized protein LOC18445287 isoform X1 [Amborella trichopoda]XP_020529849.1 uncharacterized protein LOC18445287 isoform X1 [Amborella trichopoda]XP_020529850.1 uncharacterized protein LOC18445287 isoform X1 [Amborella trichopoda]ERN16955.1 hypothetical protein AMTR_s00057p00195320 [Amborella trichopoda]|eukprot:XP_020529848.1 uncharacterized protein LOC18445287 isoform X1 [Amborella trichopoda]